MPYVHLVKDSGSSPQVLKKVYNSFSLIYMFNDYTDSVAQNGK